MSTVPQKVEAPLGVVLADSTATRSPWPTPNCSQTVGDTELASRTKSPKPIRRSP